MFGNVCVCIYCRLEFKPNPRAIIVVNGKREIFQKACSRKACQLKRKAEAVRNWREKKKAELATKVLEYARKWRAEHPDYWKLYRKKHSAYREKEELRMKNKRAGRVAKVNGIRRDPVGYLNGLRVRGLKSVAKVNGIAESVDGLVDYLALKEGVAKVARIARNGGVV